MGAVASQITNLTIVYLTVYSGADHRKHQSSPSMAFVRGIHRWPMNSPHKGRQLRRKCFHLMTSSWLPPFYLLTWTWDVSVARSWSAIPVLIWSGCSRNAISTLYPSRCRFKNFNIFSFFTLCVFIGSSISSSWSWVMTNSWYKRSFSSSAGKLVRRYVWFLTRMYSSSGVNAACTEQTIYNI